MAARSICSPVGSAEGQLGLCLEISHWHCWICANEESENQPDSHGVQAESGGQQLRQWVTHSHRAECCVQCPEVKPTLSSITEFPSRSSFCLKHLFLKPCGRDQHTGFANVSSWKPVCGVWPHPPTPGSGPAVAPESEGLGYPNDSHPLTSETSQSNCLTGQMRKWKS